MIDEMEAKAKNCRLAMKAAMEAIQDYCGTGETEGHEPDMPSLRFPGRHSVPMDYVPEDIVRIIDESATSESAINKLMEHGWVIDQSNKSQYLAVPEDAPEKLRDDYIEYAKKSIAKTLYWDRAKGYFITATERAALTRD